MDAARWATLQTLFHEALEVPKDEREAFVEQHAQHDSELAAELQALLRAADAVPSYLDTRAAWSFDRAPEEASLTGHQVGPYRLVRELGRGGQGRVFLAERDDVGSTVALKVLRGGLAAPDLMQRFLTERRVLAGLDHPHIARLLDAGTVEAEAPGDETPYFVMEWVDGSTILDHVRTRDVSLTERLRLAVQICEAVDFAHRRLVVHRDLKPTNILVTEDAGGTPSVKLLDFGIAKLLDESDADSLTRTGHRLMTPEYAAPEQVVGEPVTVATDIYALGVVLYEMLAGERPYDTSGGLRSAIQAICDEVPVPPSSRVSSGAERGRLQGDLDAIVGKALAKAPAERYRSAGALAEDIERHLRNEPVLARPPTFRYRAARFVRRNVYALGAAILLATVLIGITAREVVLRQRADAALAESRASEREANAMSALLRDAFAGGDQFGQADVRTDTLRATDLLERASARLETRLPDQPLLRARLMGQLHVIFANLGDRDRAIRELLRADSLLLAVGAPAAERIRTSGWLGEQYVAVGRCQEALEWFDERSLLQRQAGITGVDVTSARIGRATALQCLGREREALETFASIRRFARSASAEDRARLGYKEMLLNYGHALYRAGRPAEAIDVLSECLPLYEASFPSGSPVISSVVLHLGEAYMRAEQAEAADRVLRPALASSRDRVGQEHLQTLRIQADLARAALMMGHEAEADSLSATLVTSARRLATRSTLRLAYVLEARARVLAAQERYDEAISLAREALALEVQDASDHYWRQFNMPILAAALRARGREADAARVLRDLEAQEVLDSSSRQSRGG